LFSESQLEWFHCSLMSRTKLLIVVSLITILFIKLNETTHLSIQFKTKYYWSYIAHYVALLYSITALFAKRFSRNIHKSFTIRCESTDAWLEFHDHAYRCHSTWTGPILSRINVLEAGVSMADVLGLWTLFASNSCLILDLVRATREWIHLIESEHLTRHWTCRIVVGDDCHPFISVTIDCRFVLSNELRYCSVLSKHRNATFVNHFRLCLSLTLQCIKRNAEVEVQFL